MALRQLTYLVIFTSLTIASCAPTPTPALTATPLPPTASPTQTPKATPSPTPAVTITPTPSPSEIAEALGLPVENSPSPYKHSYRIEGDRLMDYLTPVPTVAAQRVNGEWKAVTDMTAKYLDLANTLKGPPLIGFDLGGGDMAHGDERYRQTEVAVIFTGQYRVINGDHQGLVVYPQNKNHTKVEFFWVSMFSDRTKGKILLRPKVLSPQTLNFLKAVGVDEALEFYQPGQTWHVNFVGEGPYGEFVYFQCANNGFCTDEFNRLEELRIMYKREIEIFNGTWKSGDPYMSAAPDDLVIPPNMLFVIVDSYP